MAGKTKRKPQRRIWPLLSPVTVALNNATALTAAEKKRLMAPIRAAFDALRRGQCSELQWLELATCCQVALCIEDLRVVTGLRDTLNEADQVLGTIHARATAGDTPWRAPTLYSSELAAVEMMVTAFAFQSAKLSAKEFRAATTLAIAHQRQRGGEVRKREAEAAAIP